MTTSFSNLFRQGHITHIEIPIIQRDYAQGRKDVGVTRIRRTFLQVLYNALTRQEAVGLDFIYGEVENGGLIPLDGQQRLTTLFLLHWYLAARSGVADGDCAFLGKFTYKTRFSARHFCEKLFTQRPPFPLASLSEWLTDQHWYAGAWKHDPTIQSMLIALDDIHNLFANDDVAVCKNAWDCLVTETHPAISFQFLSLKGLGLGRADELYIKMNSRGKPLTAFESFKANFEKTLGEVSEDGRSKFICKVDDNWADLLWPLRDSGNGESDTVIDDEFLRLFHFISEIFVLRNNLSEDFSLFDADIDAWAEGIYGKKNKDGQSALGAQRDLFASLDSFAREFLGMKKPSEFTNWFAGYFTEKVYRSGTVAIFGEINLFSDCCTKYNGVKHIDQRQRKIPLNRTLLLFAIHEYLKSTPRLQRKDITHRLRTLRNLVFNSGNEITEKDFPDLLRETAEYISNGALSRLQHYNKRQLAEEGRKADFLASYSSNSDLPETLHRLEDHDLLRGCLDVFDLNVDDSTFLRQADLFFQVFPENEDSPFREISGALLACGNYGLNMSSCRIKFGSPTRASTWRDLLTGASVSQDIRNALVRMLDEFDAAPGVSVKEKLLTIANSFLTYQEHAKKLEWRYYLVKHEAMRSGETGIYGSSNGKMGFNLCMFNKEQWNSKYSDPYLLAVIAKSGKKIGQDLEALTHYSRSDNNPEKRWIKLVTGECVMSCREDGFQLQAPEDAAKLAVFKNICIKHKVDNELMLRIPQTGDGTYDEEDRIEAAANLLKELIDGYQALAQPTIASGSAAD